MVRACSSCLPVVSVTHFTSRFHLVQYAIDHVCSVLTRASSSSSSSSYYYYYSHRSLLINFFSSNAVSFETIIPICSSIHISIPINIIFQEQIM
jgi:hypothetical protein